MSTFFKTSRRSIRMNQNMCFQISKLARLVAQLGDPLFLLRLQL